jgi:hypothetical protein
MEGKQEYWPRATSIGPFYTAEVRAVKAWELIHGYGLVGGRIREAEDSAGRAVLEVMPPQEIVERAFAIADAFINMAEARGEIRHCTEEDEEAAFQRGGQLERIKSEALYPKKNIEELAEEMAARKQLREEAKAASSAGA